MHSLTIQLHRRGVSIHAPLTGGDFDTHALGMRRRVSIHAPLTGGDGEVRRLGEARDRFQSTPPSREATGR